MKWRSVAIAAAVASLSVLLGACDGKGTSPDELFLPPTGFEADPAQGRQLFAENCARCHGAEAGGTDQGPPLIHRIYEPSHHSNFAFYRAIDKGTRQHHWTFGDMPPVEGVSAKEAGHIVAYLRREQRRAGIR